MKEMHEKQLSTLKTKLNHSHIEAKKKEESNVKMNKSKSVVDVYSLKKNKQNNKEKMIYAR